MCPGTYSSSVLTQGVLHTICVELMEGNSGLEKKKKTWLLLPDTRCNKVQLELIGRKESR